MSYALITGASKGIGKAIGEELASKGFDILLVARSTSLLKENAEEISSRFNVQCSYLTADLAEPGSAQQVFDWCIKNNYAVSVLVNNAGFGSCGFFEKIELNEQHEMMQVNMVTPVLLCHIFVPLLHRQPKAYILNIGSTTAYHAIPLMSIYAASKSFILRFSRALHEELHKTNISVTCVCPGTTETDFANRARVNPKTIQKGKKISMSPRSVAKTAVRAMLSGKKEVVPGFINKLTVFLVWLLPHKWVERAAMNIYNKK
jgi:short-subunit dehydrogenase